MPGRQRKPHDPRPQADAAFINVPYDKKYVDLYLAFIAGLCGFGLIPRATLEISGSERRLDRIMQLIRSCRYSFHDLSRVEIDPRPPRTPRFNMPFELGLIVAWTMIKNPTHEWYIFEARSHRLGKSLSDLAGTDPHIHQGTPRGLLRALMNALVRRRERPSLKELELTYNDVRRAAAVIRRVLRTDTLFGAHAFKEVVVAATRSARNRIAALKKT